MGRLNEAREVIEQLRATGADLEPHPPFPNREIHGLLISGLRLAAGEAV
jgi:hypothetical protein